jgi:spore maturation protein CgeB
MNVDIVILGLSITSSWGNGHASTYRALVKALARRGHRITFLERDVPWYREHRDLRSSPHCRIELYPSLKDISSRYGTLIRKADLVILGSFVPDGAVIGDWITTQARGITAFYDIDTPVTLARLNSGPSDYITAAMIPRFDLYLSFTGGPVLELIEQMYGSPRARVLYCAVDPDLHIPAAVEPRWALGYLGTYSKDRQPALERLLIEPAQSTPDLRFVVAGAQYPRDIAWPANVQRVEHVPPNEHAAFYCAQRYTLNVTRAGMVSAGFSPSVRLFEAAACATPIISDRWPGIDTLFTLGEEILIADVPEHVVHLVRDIPEDRRQSIGAAARRRVLRDHTADHRAEQLESYYREAVRDSSKGRIEAVA